MVAKSSGNFPSNHGPAHRNPFIMSFIALYEEIKHSDLQKIRATRRRKMELKHSCLQLSTLWLYSEYPGNYSHNTSKINTSTRLVQEINNEDHNCCQHCDRNRWTHLSIACDCYFFSRRFTLSRGPPEWRLLGRTIRADCLRRMFAQALLVALTWGTELGLLSSHSARQSDNQKSWREKNNTIQVRTLDNTMTIFMISRWTKCAQSSWLSLNHNEIVSHINYKGLCY